MPTFNDKSIQGIINIIHSELTCFGTVSDKSIQGIITKANAQGITITDHSVQGIINALASASCSIGVQQPGFRLITSSNPVRVYANGGTAYVSSAAMNFGYVPDGTLNFTLESDPFGTPPYPSSKFYLLLGELVISLPGGVKTITTPLMVNAVYEGSQPATGAWTGSGGAYNFFRLWAPSSPVTRYQVQHPSNAAFYQYAGVFRGDAVRSNPYWDFIGDYEANALSKVCMRALMPGPTVSSDIFIPFAVTVGQTYSIYARVGAVEIDATTSFNPSSFVGVPLTTYSEYNIAYEEPVLAGGYAVETYPRSSSHDAVWNGIPSIPSELL